MLRTCRKLVFAAGLMLLGSQALAQPVGSFADFVREFEARAVSAGISRDTYRAAMAGVTFDSSIGRLISGQPEFTTPIWEYLDGRVSANRIARGRDAMARNAALFEVVGQRFGVDPYILGAIWGMETDFGAVLDNSGLIKRVLNSLATLSYERRGRVTLDEAELIAALQLVQDGFYTSHSMVGSWAGAIGHLQVSPSVLVRFATDGDGDGRVDPHRSLADALATSAVLVNSFEYQRGVDWGFEVDLPAGFDLTLATRTQMRPVGFFAERGVTRVAGREFSDLGTEVFLYLPAGISGPKFLMTQNYLVLKDYNFSDSYALSVAHLTDRLRGSGPFVTPWPRQTQFPNLAQRTAVQQRLKALGFYDGEVDGRLGPISQEAYQRFQAANGIAPDGFITLEAARILGVQ